MTMDPVTHVEDVHHQHASVKTYIIIAVILTVVTIAELCIPYLPQTVIPQWLGISALAVLSIFKFALVVMFFMHLYYDSHLMTFLFVIGLLLATGTLLSTKALMNVHSLEKPEPIGAKKVELLPADATRGKAAFSTAACPTCHVVTEIPNATGKTGPTLDGIADRAGTRKPPMDAKAYIEESINEPNAFIVQGYGPPFMTSNIRDTLSDQEYTDIVAYLLTLHEKK